jgi:hypothetical protein
MSKRFTDAMLRYYGGEIPTIGDIVRLHREGANTALWRVTVITELGTRLRLYRDAPTSSGSGRTRWDAVTSQYDLVKRSPNSAVPGVKP